MEYRIIKSPSAGTLKILNSRRRSTRIKALTECDAIGLIQGKLLDMLAAADLAEKAADVQVEEIRGVCPQQFSLIAIFGDTASVEAAVQDVMHLEKEERRLF